MEDGNAGIVFRQSQGVCCADGGVDDVGDDTSDVEC